MHEAVTHTFKNNTISINLKDSNDVTQTDTPTAFGWPKIYDPDSDKLLDNYLSSPNYISPLSVTFDHFQRFSKTSPDLSSYLPVTAMNDNQPPKWAYNPKLQHPDPSWNIADGISRLNIGDVGVDSPIRTPPKPNAVGDKASSPNASPPGRGTSVSHSRGSSIDANSHEAVHPVGGNVLNPSSLKGSPINELKERPHSFSGGLSSADLRKLQLAGDEGSEPGEQMQPQWPSAHPREGSSNDRGEQLSYPSLASNVAPINRNGAPPFENRAGQVNVPFGEDFVYPRNVHPQGNVALAQPGQGRPPNAYRALPPRNFPQPGAGALPSPTGMAFPVVSQALPPLSLGNPQQVYDMMLSGNGPDALNPALNRVQQQNVFRHQHSSSDPSALRDAAALALLNSNMQAFAPMFTPMATPPAMYGQFYGQDGYPRPSSNAAAAVAQAMAARLQSQYTGGYGMMNPQLDQPLSSPTNSAGGQSGPSANNRKLGLYKTELCRSWEEKGTCRYGTKCQFAHGEDELRKVARHPKYKTEICRTFWVSGSCPYGKRCCFIHTELPQSGGATTSATTEPSSAPGHARTRSLSTNSDPNDTSVSLLARISKRNGDSPAQNASTPPTGAIESPSFQNQRPPTGSLRVDTAGLDGASMKQNKSAYPTFASNGVLLPNPEYIKAKSPAPVTAGPDLGRHNASRLEIVGYNNQRIVKSTTPPSNGNSYNEDAGFSPSPPIPGQSYGLSGEGAPSANPPRANGHVRAGSAGNWASLTRGSHLSSSFPSPGGDGNVSSPWTTTELAPVGARIR